jgi:hypothetical protein
MPGSNVIHHVSSSAEPRVCTVLECQEKAGRLRWPTKDRSGGWPITWAVCSFHYWHLDAGHAFIKVHENEPSTHRWLLTEDNLTEGSQLRAVACRGLIPAARARPDAA